MRLCRQCRKYTNDYSGFLPLSIKNHGAYPSSLVLDSTERIMKTGNGAFGEEIFYASLIPLHPARSMLPLVFDPLAIPR